MSKKRFKEVFLSVVQVGDRYHISRSSVRRHSLNGRLPKPLVIGTQLRWRLSDLLKFEDSQSANQPIEVEA